ncbi:MAG: FHA domain-containing protein [Deltaproteobacteria bacterium]|nr:FHA domain-containing protein [Deltaproteobacteria bacterium]
MPRFRLRYQSTNLEMPLGEFAIGRSSSCNLALADGLVSRKHAVLHVGPDSVVVEDLGSRNGVAVNGVRIKSPRRLAHMDRVYIGSQELVMIDAAKLRDRGGATADYVVCETCGAINGSAKRRCGECGRRLTSAAGETLVSSNNNGVDSSSHAWGAEDTRTARALDVIAGIASKAIAMGRFEEAERILLPHLDNILERALAHRPLSDSERDDDDVLFAGATSYALQLAQGLKATKWIDWVFRIHTATGRLMEAETIETLHNLVRNNNYSRPDFLRAYLRVVQNRAGDYGASERFLLRRIEGLEQVVTAY